MLLVPTLHPAYLLRSGDGAKGEARFKDTVEHDLRKAKRFLSSRPQWDESVIWQRDKAGRLVNLFPTALEVFEFCQRALTGKCEISVDVETTGEQALACQLICIGMAASNGDAICVPFLRQGGHEYWSASDKQYIVDLLRWFFMQEACPKVLQNGHFDTQVLWGTFGFWLANYSFDTILAHHCVDAELPHGLGYLGSRYLDVRYWKDDVKGKLGWLELDDETLRSYNVRDCLVTLRLKKPLLKLLGEYGVYELFLEEMQLNYIFTKAAIKGVRVDLSKRDAMGVKLRADRAAALVDLQRIAGTFRVGEEEAAEEVPFNPRSNPQLTEVLYHRLKFPVLLKTAKGAPAANREALVLLAFQAETEDQVAFLKALTKYRKADKMLGTYVEGLPILGDQRLHVSWKVFGTTTGRLSSSPNAQNWNDLVCTMFCAPEGSKIVSVDLSQAELRRIAYETGDEDLLHAYELNLNVHTVNATLLFGVRNPGEDTNPATEAYLEATVPKHLGVAYQSLPVAPADKWKRIRRLAKTGVFADNYGAMAETMFARIRSEKDPETDELIFPDLEFSEVEAMKLAWERLHPKIPKWWDTICNKVRWQKHYRDPLSGRIQWYRGGFNRNEMLNRPIQSGVAAHVNKATIRINRRLEQELGGRPVIILQVHDALYVEALDADVEAVKRILVEELSKSFELPGFPNAVLPPDKPKATQYLVEEYKPKKPAPAVAA